MESLGYTLAFHKIMISELQKLCKEYRIKLSNLISITVHKFKIISTTNPNIICDLGRKFFCSNMISRNRRVEAIVVLQRERVQKKHFIVEL